MTDQKRAEFVTLGTLKTEFGFSAKWITALGPPDQEKPNPRYRTAAPMKLYAVNRVLAFIADHQAAYDVWIQERAKRSGAARRGAEQRLERAEELRRQRAAEAERWATNVPTEILRLPRYAESKACQHFGTDSVNDRGVIAYLRHRYTNYDDLLREMGETFGGPTWRDTEALRVAAGIIRWRVISELCRRAGYAWNGGNAGDGAPW